MNKNRHLIALMAMVCGGTASALDFDIDHNYMVNTIPHKTYSKNDNNKQESNWKKTDLGQIKEIFDTPIGAYLSKKNITAIETFAKMAGQSETLDQTLKSSPKSALERAVPGTSQLFIVAQPVLSCLGITEKTTLGDLEKTANKAVHETKNVVMTCIHHTQAGYSSLYKWWNS